MNIIYIGDTLITGGDDGFATEELKMIKLAEECGLQYAGRDDDGEVEFLGKTEAFEKFEKAQEI